MPNYFARAKTPEFWTKSFVDTVANFAKCCQT